MHIILWLGLVVGAICAGFGLLTFFGLSEALSHSPAIVAVPQLTMAILTIGFGSVTAAICAAGLGIIAALDMHLTARGASTFDPLRPRDGWVPPEQSA